MLRTQAGRQKLQRLPRFVVAGVLQSDSCRLAQLRCHTARDGHPFQLFSWGNRRSLWEQPKAAGIAIRDRIVKYYRWVAVHKWGLEVMKKNMHVTNVQGRS